MSEDDRITVQAYYEMVVIPTSLDGSFYQGKVHVGIKEAIFEPSSVLHLTTDLLTTTLMFILAGAVQGPPLYAVKGSSDFQPAGCGYMHTELL